jgi:predicted metal-dependent hydrolase
MAERDLLHRAVDLFNRKLYFECHDLLEEAWSEARGEERAFLQGLIHAAVGLYHLAAGTERGAESQLRQAVERLGPFRAGREGLDLAAFSAALQNCLSKIEKASHPGKVDWRAEEIPRLFLHQNAR